MSGRHNNLWYKVMSFVVRLLFIWGFLLLIDPGTQVCVTTAGHWFLVVEIMVVFSLQVVWKYKGRGTCFRSEIFVTKYFTRYQIHLL